MSLETGLLLMESVLLLVTIALLVSSIREGRARDKLLLEMGKTTRILARVEYFLAVTDAMTDATTELVGWISGRAPVGDDRKRVQEIVERIGKLTGGGVDVKYLLPRFQDRLYIGYRYTSAGAEVRYTTNPQAQDLRYIVVDGKAVVMGIPESIGEAEAVAKGYRVPSASLSQTLREHFYSWWEKGTPYEAYVLEVLRSSGATPAFLAQELHIDQREIERILAAGR